MKWILHFWGAVSFWSFWYLYLFRPRKKPLTWKEIPRMVGLLTKLNWILEVTSQRGQTPLLHTFSQSISYINSTSINQSDRSKNESNRRGLMTFVFIINTNKSKNLTTETWLWLLLLKRNRAGEMDWKMGEEERERKNGRKRAREGKR